jgi:hypothetical protein
MTYDEEGRIRPLAQGASFFLAGRGADLIEVSPQIAQAYLGL